MIECSDSGACKSAVTRAYRELMQRGYRDQEAFESAVTVYRCRHPDASAKDVPYVVAEWICEELGQ